MGKLILEEQFSLKKSLIWNSAGSSVYTVCQALTTILVYRLSTAAVAGDLSLAVAISTIFSYIAHYNIRNYQVSDLAPKYPAGIYISTRLLTCSVSFILCFAYIAFCTYTLEQKTCVLLYMAFRIGETLLDTYYGIDQLANRMDILGKSLILRGVFILTTFIFGLIATGSLNVSILLMGISTFAVAAVYDIPHTRVLNNIKPIFDFKRISALLLECLPLAINWVIAGCLISIPRIYLQGCCSSSELGIYTSVASPILVVQLLSSYILTPILTALSERLEQDDSRGFFRLAAKCAAALGVISVAAILGTVFLGRIALIIVFTAKIAPYCYLLMPAIYFSLLQIIANFLSTIFTVIRKLVLLTISNVLLLISCLAGTPYFVGRYSMQGVNFVLIFATLIQIVFLIAAAGILLFQYKKGKLTE
jgi:O-antigen/teichoic acid export membrane protein